MSEGRVRWNDGVNGLSIYFLAILINNIITSFTDSSFHSSEFARVACGLVTMPSTFLLISTSSIL
jgi:hypothetical protein